MPLKEPSWWYVDHEDWRARLLEPIGSFYGDAALRRFQKRVAYRSRLPVICVGNLTAGGAGKTPLAIFTAQSLISRGERPAILTRGYGGREAGPLWVAHDRHTANEVGDEPILLAATAPTLVSRDRRAGARAIEARQDTITTIIMDDGLQNPGLKKDLTLAVIDGVRGLGNRAVIPAGPLRAPLAFQLEKTDAVVINNTALMVKAANGGESLAPTRLVEEFRRTFPGPVIEARTQPTGNIDWLKEKPVVAFAGIGHPQRFFDMLSGLGATIAAEMAYVDHHSFTETDVDTLLTLRARHNAVLVTTEKDMARLANLANAAPNLNRLADRARTLGIEISFDAANTVRFSSLLDAVIKTGGYRNGNFRR